ncbi:MAG: serine hydrolase [bacterium]
MLELAKKWKENNLNMKRTIKILNFILPYFLVLLGVFLVLLTPLSFYSEKNLKLSFVNIDKRILSANSLEQPIIMGGDVQALNFPKANPIIPLAKHDRDYDGKLSAVSAVVLDVKSKKVLFSKKEKQVRPLASITKLMSVITLLDFPVKWSATTTIIEEDGHDDNLVEFGETFALEDLWNLALVGSSNKAVNALIRGAGLNIDEFVVLMNKKAQELGLDSLEFSEPTGLSDKNIGNAVDVAGLLQQALRFDKIYTSLQTGEYYAKPCGQDKVRRVWSTNWLLTNWIPNEYGSNCIVGKTGYIPESDFNFVVDLVNENQRQIITVILGASSNEQRYIEARDLSDWIFDKYVWPGDLDYNDMVE